MKEWICREISTSTRDAENGILTMETELIRCKDCKHMREDGVESYCDDSGRYIDGTGFCSWAERKEE